MTAALERVIAEQQKEIDRLKNWQETNAQTWIKHNEKLEQFMQDAIYFLNNHANSKVKGARLDFYEAIQRMGWCMRCEQNPCACDD